MAKLKTWLTGLLAIQLVLVAGLFWSNEYQQQQNIQQRLFSFKQADVNKVVISDSDNSVSISKVNGQWLLPDVANLPANVDKLTDVLAKLKSIQTGWPVATTTSSHERFEVSEDKFQRQVQLYQGDKLVGELLVGTSPGFRKVHIRKPEEDVVYTAKLNSYELPAKGDDWLDKSLLAAGGVDKIKSIKGADYYLEKSGDSWTFAINKQPLLSSETIDTKLDVEKAKQLAKTFTNFQVQGVAKSPPKADNTDNKQVTIEVVTEKGSFSYQLTTVKDKYFAKRSDIDQTFTISKYDYERIAQIGLSQLAADTQMTTEGQVPLATDQPSEKVETSQSDEEEATGQKDDSSKS
ncbi:DUF4340 domain-containing protein [Endozoicomonas sp. SM1973]|uniref:DUF4340 domain-containing protein n=1 Tax=Spartinivicinus marinus TaxID=2994442 RepID=A0A853I2W7_9GAMM|nr:DUF4340 domain-containing protein [Spartinivicinus marinus]MCX4029250.1 DUF4340 domain-containing protein [Spartinivicinus marinus]NYZ65842.1 DUF4340 domain-containing protein [Spartinivicinus marinus]